MFVACPFFNYFFTVEILFQDTDIFGKLIDDDIAAAKTPVALIAFAGMNPSHFQSSLCEILELF